jgi:membrane protease YdiL (CAAX protease family)
MSGVFRAGDGRVRSGWVLLVFALVAGVVIGGLNVGLLLLLGDALPRLDELSAARFTWPTLAGALAATAICHVAFREPVGLARLHAARRFGLGLVASAALLALACGVPALVGVTTLHGSGTSPGQLLRVVGVHAIAVAPTAIAEELLLRGVPLRALSRGTHPAVAVGLTSGVFGALHLLNPNASLVAAVNVALVGLWFGAVAVRTGSLWMPFGLHVGWNFAEGVLFGQPVSGLMPGTSLLASTWPRKATFFSGGDFGPEAAGWTALLLAVALVSTVAWPARRKTPEPAAEQKNAP